MKRPLRIRAAGVAICLVLAGCDQGREAIPQRPSDGLLGDAELQAVVDLQVQRRGGELIALLTAPRAAVRARAALALASVQDPEAVPGLIGLLDDEDAAVRRDAAFALGQSGDAAAAVPLADAFQGEADGDVRYRIMEALSKIPSMDAVSGLMGLTLQGDEEADRALALARLGATRGMASAEGQAYLLARLTDGDPEVRANAAYYFGRLAEPGSWVPSARRVREALDGYGRSDPAAMYLCQALGRAADPADGGRLREWLTSARDWRIRVNAALALGTLPPNPQNREALLLALDDPSEHVASSAGQALARGTPMPSELSRMMSWIEANPDRWRVAAPLMLLLAQGDERDFVFGWLDGLALDDAYRWEAGLRALGVMPGVEAVERLQRAVASPNNRIMGGAVGALVQRWGQDRFFSGNTPIYFAIFSDVLTGTSLQASFSAAGALGDPLFVPLGSADTLAAAYAQMTAPEQLEPMIGILESLGRAGGPRATEVLMTAATDPHAGIRRTAVTALEQLGLTPPPFEEDERTAEADAPAVTPEVDWAYLASLGSAPHLTLETERGSVVLQLHPEEAPLTVQTVVRLASDGKYDGVPFHRVVPNFVVQGGDFSSGDGFGGPGFTITSEFTLVPFRRGVVGMASAGKDTEGSQFFLTHSMQPHLDGGYTTFGWVVDGMDVVDQLLVGDHIVRTTLEAGS